MASRNNHRQIEQSINQALQSNAQNYAKLKLFNYQLNKMTPEEQLNYLMQLQREMELVEGGVFQEPSKKLNLPRPGR